MSQKVLQDWHLDFVIMWKDNEGMSLPEAHKRLVDYFPEAKTTFKALEIRYYKRRKQLENGTIQVKGLKKHLPSPEDLSDDQMIEWVKLETYRRTLLSAYADDDAGWRRNADLTLKVLRAKRDLAGATDESDEEKQAKALLKLVQGGRDEDEDAEHKELN